METNVKFKVGISGDLINSSGDPCFGNKSLDILKDLYDIDKMIKTFKHGIDYKFELLILKACNNVRN